MSFLEMLKATLPNMTSGTISFWVKVGSVKPKRDVWNQKWMPPDIQYASVVNDPKGITYLGGNYYHATVGFGDDVVPCVLPCYPPGDTAFSSRTVETDGRLGTHKDNLVPFLTFGNPGLKYKRTKWEVKKIGKHWEMIEGRGIGTFNVYSTVLQGGGTNEAGEAPPPSAPPPEGDNGGGEDGVVPQSCFGLRNGKLRIILQTTGTADYKGYAFSQSRLEEVHVISNAGHPGDQGEWETLFYKDFSEDHPMFLGGALFYDDVSDKEHTQHPEAFVLDPQVPIQDGKWHHIALSFKIDGTVKSKGTYSTHIDPHPGVWGMFSYDPDNPFPGGAPNENCGKLGPCDGGTMESDCRAWLSIDDKNINNFEGQTASFGNPNRDKGNLNHHDAWLALSERKGTIILGTKSSGGSYAASDIWHQEEGKGKGQDLLDSIHKNAIFPPNAFVGPYNDPRLSFVTNLTNWERFYRTLLGATYGVETISRIPDVGESRRFDYALPEYSFTVPPGGIECEGFPIGIPAGSWMSNNDGQPNAPVADDAEGNLNDDIMMAELQIWANKTLDFSEEKNRRLFITKDGEPEVSYIAVDEMLGKPHIRLHGTGNWKQGLNTGSIGYKVTGKGEDRKRVKLPDGQFVAYFEGGSKVNEARQKAFDESKSNNKEEPNKAEDDEGEIIRLTPDPITKEGEAKANNQ